MLNNKRTVIVCVAAFAGIALSLFGCGDDDKKVDSGAIADSICKSMVQCEGKLGKLPGTLTAADVQNKIDTCNSLIVAKFFNNAKSDSEAADYIKCLEGLDCNTLDSVYTSQGDTVPQACQSQHQAYTNKGGNGGNSGNGSVITCDPNNEVCACFNDSCNPRWITDNSCICQRGGSSNPPTGQCADDDIACWCKKSPNLPACQGSSNPPADQCADNDVECICKKNPNLPACQETPPPADQCSDDDVECICKKNPNLPACQGSNPPADQCADNDVECICKKNPNLPACQGGDQGAASEAQAYCKQILNKSCNTSYLDYIYNWNIDEIYGKDFNETSCVKQKGDASSCVEAYKKMLTCYSKLSCQDAQKYSNLLNEYSKLNVYDLKYCEAGGKDAKCSNNFEVQCRMIFDPCAGEYVDYFYCMYPGTNNSNNEYTQNYSDAPKIKEMLKMVSAYCADRITGGKCGESFSSEFGCTAYLYGEGNLININDVWIPIVPGKCMDKAYNYFKCESEAQCGDTSKCLSLYEEFAKCK